MCWAPEGKIITFKEWKEDLGGTPNGKPWWAVGLDDPI
jgi:hypothetical protein